MDEYLDQLNLKIEELRSKDLSQTERHEVVTLWTESLILSESKGREYHFYKRLMGALTRLNSLLAKKGLTTVQFPPPVSSTARNQAILEVIGD
jgi:hypothetical protein